MVFSLVNILFIAISTLLIYSLLLVTVEKKTFVNGILRMVGLKKSAFITMVILQSVFFVLPSIVAGICLSPLCLYLLYNLMFEDVNEISYFPAGNAVLQAICIGILIPTLASIVPII